VRKVILLLSFLLLSPLLAQTINVGTLSFNPPFEMEADQKNHFVGFEIDIMMELCKRMQADCHFIPLTFEEIFTKLLANKIDLGLGAISITEQRRTNYLFSLPYMKSTARFITKINSQTQGINDIRNKRVGSEEGTLFKDVVLEIFNHEVEVVEYPTLGGVFQALADGKVDIVITDGETAKYWVTNNNELFNLVDNEIHIGIGYGIMANKKHKDFVETIDKLLSNIEADGSYLEIYKRYFS
jgi:ABC-type amino acid transport substrate-binding protein